MPKIVGYPRASLDNSGELATAVYELGGHSTIHTCADKMNKSVSGAFKALVSAADKFGLIKNQRGDLTCTDLFNQLKHAYSEEEEKLLLRKAFLSSSVFLSLYERFRGQVVPADILDRILVREFDVPAQAASRVSGYFINGAKQVGLLDEDNKLIDIDRPMGKGSEGTKTDVDVEHGERASGSEAKTADIQSPIQNISSDAYSVEFRGPGMNTTIEISEEPDIKIVEAILEKIKKKTGISGGSK